MTQRNEHDERGRHRRSPVRRQACLATAIQKARDRQRIGTALHLDCSRTYIGKLEAEGVIQRQGDGFPLDQSRVAYLRFLRRERRQSPRSEADTDFQRAKSELIRLRIAEKQRHLIPLEEAVGHMDEVVGLFISRLSGFAARCGGRDLAGRRVIDQAVHDLRLEISQACTALADQRGEPLDDDA